MPTVVNPNLLQSCREAARCEICGEPPPAGCALDPCHLFARGMGSGSRVDIPENLLAGCRRCHDNAHRGLIPRRCLLALVAVRERLTIDEVEQRYWDALRGIVRTA